MSSNHALSFRLRTNSLIDGISLSKWKVKEVGKRAISLCSNSQSLLAFVVKVSWLFFCLPNFQFDGRRSIISSYPFVFDIIVSMAFPLRSKSWMTPHLGFAYTPKRPIHQSDISYLHIISTCERMSLGNICLVFSCVKAWGIGPVSLFKRLFSASLLAQVLDSIIEGSCLVISRFD